MFLIYFFRALNILLRWLLQIHRFLIDPKVASYFLVRCVLSHLTCEHFDQLEKALRRYPSLAEPLISQTAASDPILAAQLVIRMYQALIQPQALRRIVLSWLAGGLLTSASLTFLQVWYKLNSAHRNLLTFYSPQASVDTDPDMLYTAEVFFHRWNPHILIANIYPPCPLGGWGRGCCCDQGTSWDRLMPQVLNIRDLKNAAQRWSMNSLRLSKWLAGCLVGLVANCKEENRTRLQKRLRSNKTFLRSKLLKLVEK